MSPKSNSLAPDPVLRERYERAQATRAGLLARLRGRIQDLKPAPRVLLVEDDPDQARMLTTFLQTRVGVEVETFHSGQSALDRVRQMRRGEFVGALVDLHLGDEIAGDEIARELPRGVAVYLVTGALHEALHEAGHRVSATRCFEKPLTSADYDWLCADLRARAGLNTDTTVAPH